MSSTTSLRYFAIQDGSLVASGQAPTELVQLAGDLYRYVRAEVPVPSKAKRKEKPQGDSPYFTVVIVPNLAINPFFSPNIEELRTWNMEQIASQTSRWIEQWILESPESEYPPRLAATYGLIRLDLAMTTSDPLQILEAACVAGRCLGIAARAAGMVQGVSRGSKKAAAQRWTPRDAIRAQMRERYQAGNWSTKAQFIRDNQEEVLTWSKKHRLATTATSVGPLMRKWIRDL
jgi:hypothetical protein